MGKSFLVRGALVLAAVLAPSAVSADRGARAAIEAAYDKEAQAAALLFVNGVLSDQGDDCRVVIGGRPGPVLAAQRDRLLALFSNALSISETTRIVRFNQPDALHAVVAVEQKMSVTRVATLADAPETLIFESEQLVRWQRYGDRWLQAEVNIVHQRVSHSGR